MHRPIHEGNASRMFSSVRTIYEFIVSGAYTRFLCI